MVRLQLVNAAGEIVECASMTGEYQINIQPCDFLEAVQVVAT